LAQNLWVTQEPLKANKKEKRKQSLQEAGHVRGNNYSKKMSDQNPESTRHRNGQKYDPRLA
jgi:hypothetical protein